MAKGWKCDRCSTKNDEGACNCTNCGLIRGSVVVPGTYTPPQPNVLLPLPTPPDLSTPQEPAPAPSDTPAAAQGVGAPLATDWVTPPPANLSASRPIWRRIPIRLVFFAVLILGGSVAGWITNASRSATGDITKGGDLTSNDRVGDCWDIKDPAANVVDNVTARPCGESHKYEVFFIGSLPEGAYPTEDEFSTYVGSACVSAFGSYIGTAYADSSLDITWLYPKSDGWAAGDRTVECSAYNPTANKLTASLKGSRQ